MGLEDMTVTASHKFHFGDHEKLANENCEEKIKLEEPRPALLRHSYALALYNPYEDGNPK
jgi:hypothetical protein